MAESKGQRRGQCQLEAGEVMSRSWAKSVAAYEEACRVIPGGVNSPVRSFRSVGGTPIYFRQARGSRFWDLDGNEYIDFCLSWGPLILGHAHPRVVQAVQQAAEDGLSYGACHERELELARLILQALPEMEQIRFVNSGTEAVMTALRLARGTTSRPLILKFEGCYHGHCDSLLVKAGSGLATAAISDSAGVPEEIAAQTLVAPLDAPEVWKDLFRLHGAKIAAAIIEPIPANNGLLEQARDNLYLLRQLTQEQGGLLIFDEVISGFRFHYGGYYQKIGVVPDLLTLGKIIGGGMPVGAVVGKRALMELLAPLGKIYQAGTLSGNPVALAAGIATLRELRDSDIYERLERLGARFDTQLEPYAQATPWLRWRRLGSVMWFHLAEGPIPRRADQIRPEAIQRFKKVFPLLLQRGFYLPPSPYEVFFLCAAHTEEEVTSLARTAAELVRC